MLKQHELAGAECDSLVLCSIHFVVNSNVENAVYT